MALKKFVDNIETSAPKVLDNKNGRFSGGIWRPYDNLAEYETAYPILASRAWTQQLFVLNADDNTLADLYVLDKNKSPVLLIGGMGITSIKQSIIDLESRLDEEIENRGNADLAITDLQKASNEILSSFNLSDKFLPTTNRPLKMMYCRNLNNDFLLAFEFPNNRMTEYRFAKDSDGLMRVFNALIGNKQTTEVLTGEGSQVVKTGIFTNSGGNTWYTTQTGATLTGEFDGTGFKFYSRRDNRGGIWRFTIDGGLPIDVSVFAAVTVDSLDPNKAGSSIDVVSGLSLGKHTVVAEFRGADPLNPPSGGTARGWFNWNVTIPLPIRIITLSDSLQLPQSQILPTLIGAFIGLNGNTYTITTGDKITGSFTGTGLEFVTYKDNRGGLWNFKIDGGSNIPISTWATTAGEQKVMVATGLVNTSHTFEATFAGNDPAHAPTGGIARGWLMYYPTYPYTFIVYPLIPKDTRSMMAEGSVLEWAINSAPEGTGLPPNWNPKHSGELNVSRNITINILVNGVDLYPTIDSVKLAYTQMDTFSLNQTFTAFNGNDVAGDFPLWTAKVSHSFFDFGAISHALAFLTSSGTWNTVDEESNPITIPAEVAAGTGHLMMLPATTAVDKVGNSRLDEQPVLGVDQDVFFAEKASGMYALYTPDKYFFFVQSLMGLDSWGINYGTNSDKDFYFRMRTDTTKGYFQSIVNSVLPPGSVMKDLKIIMIGEYDGNGSAEIENKTQYSQSNLISDGFGGWYLPVDTQGKNITSVKYKKQAETKTYHINPEMIVEDESWFPKVRVGGFDSNDTQTITVTLL